MKTKTTRVLTVGCSECGEEIYSRARHDYHTCHCCRTFVDGGFDYLRYGWDPHAKPPKVRTRYIPASREEIYADWDNATDKFGYIKSKRKQ